METFSLDFSHIKLATSLTSKVCKDTVVYNQIINDFLTKLKEERKEDFYIKNGVKKKLKPLTFISVRIRLEGIKEISQLESFFQDCLKHNGCKDFTTYFNIKTKCQSIT